MYVSRTIEAVIRRACEHFPVVMLTGARQVGKTTVLRHASGPERSFVTLDDPLLRQLAKQDPALFMQRLRPPVLIDEIQYAPELLPYIKMQVDTDRVPGQFWLTGPQQFHLMKGVTESLAGRVAILDLYGMTRREILERSQESRPLVPSTDAVLARLAEAGPLSLQALYDLIWRGSLPSIALNPSVDRDTVYGSYVQSYLERDVRDLAQVGDETAFLRFLRAAAARTGQILNLADLARAADIAPNTAKSWLSIAKTSGAVFLLEPYFANLTKRLVKAPKLYFLDTGLCTYLTQWASPETLETGAMSGAILETWVLTEVLRAYWHNGMRPAAYYVRDRDGLEIDLVIERDGMLHPYEIKKTASPSPDNVKAFAKLARMGMPVGPGGLICLARDTMPLTANAISIPVGAL